MTNREIRALADKDGLLYTIKYGIIVDEVRDGDMRDALEEARDSIRRIENILDQIPRVKVGYKGRWPND